MSKPRTGITRATVYVLEDAHTRLQQILKNRGWSYSHWLREQEKRELEKEGE